MATLEQQQRSVNVNCCELDKSLASRSLLELQWLINLYSASSANLRKHKSGTSRLHSHNALISYSKPIPPQCLKPFLQHLCASSQDQRQAEQLRSAQIPQKAGNKRGNVVWHYIIPPPKPKQTAPAVSRDLVDLGMTRSHAMADSCRQQRSSAMRVCPLD